MDNKQAHAGNELYDENFYRAQRGSYEMAKIILPVANDVIHPQSVIDIGCGVGTWLSVWQKNFGAEIYGMDGDYVDRSQLFIDEKFFHPANLEERITLDKRFDLAMSLEVAEHLSPERADSFVEDLTHLSDVILFSAAIPAQGGTNHVNEQWQSYWVKKFSRLGYVVIDFIRPKIWNAQLPPWRRANTLIFVKRSELYRYPELQEFYLKHRDGTILDAVHPELWISRLVEFQNAYNQLRNAYVNLQNQLAAASQNGGGYDSFRTLSDKKISPFMRAGIFFSHKFSGSKRQIRLRSSSENSSRNISKSRVVFYVRCQCPQIFKQMTRVYGNFRLATGDFLSRAVKHVKFYIIDAWKIFFAT